MAAYGGPLMELIRLPSAHRIFFRASVYEASPGARFARATGRRIITLNKHEHREIMLSKTPASVSAVFKELTQHPPHTLFDMWNLFLIIINVF